MVRKSDPNPVECLGADLKPGMMTYQRVAVKGTPDVGFKQDHFLREQIDTDANGRTVGCRNGVHFKSDKGTVCYFVNATIWVKDRSAEVAKAAAVMAADMERG